MVLSDGRRLEEETVLGRAKAGPQARDWRVLLAAREPRPCALCGEMTTAGVLLPGPSGGLVACPICNRCGPLVRAALSDPFSPTSAGESHGG